MGNRKFRFLSLLLVLMLLCTNITACNKASSAKSGNLAAESVDDTIESSDDESLEEISSDESTETSTGESSEDTSASQVETSVTTLEDGTTVITTSSGQQITIKEETNAASTNSSSSLQVAKSAVSGVSQESDNSSLLQSVSNSASTSVELHTFSAITASEYSAAQSIVNSIISSSMSEYTKVKTIHDYLIDSITYPSTIDTSNRSLFTCTGALINKVAVCQGYADAFSLLCYLAGVQAEIVSGPANNGSSIIGHAWNQVRIDGTWYNIDCTWDAPFVSSTEQIKIYDYFLVTDATISADHTINASAAAGYLAAKHSCTDSRYEANNANLTDDVYYSYYSTAVYGSYAKTVVTSIIIN
ncbi:transglutaminase domain-containing protein [Lachnospira multipara]|uniref:Transglutaminase-like superfamily protein n=1 Tax=Lachnospira multipara TaxID=28051 RepID=A0A1H5V1J8_9FIRM|nr:transglutaminase domain-containing protein [Lachnospira multipara]SEF81322.1 Transglutaminase-like superfamily protein [Lachnospira multipara]